MPELGVHCQAIMDLRHVDVIEMDAASHTGVDDVREIIENARYRPVSARTKVYIIDEVHMLSKQAFNGLLKDAWKSRPSMSSSCSPRPRSTRCRSRCARAASAST